MFALAANVAHLSPRLDLRLRDRVLAFQTRFSMHSQFHCSKVRLRIMLLQTKYIGCEVT